MADFALISMSLEVMYSNKADKELQGKTCHDVVCAFKGLREEIDVIMMAMIYDMALCTGLFVLRAIKNHLYNT